MVEYVTKGDVLEAYLDCRKRKRRKNTAVEYEMNYEENNYELYNDLNNGTFTVDPSICFYIKYPKLREVFAASFRTRIVHHLIVRKFESIFENYFIEDTYNCRKGKGVLYGIKRIQKQYYSIRKSSSDKCWFLKIDLKGFFMSIDKDILYGKIEKLICESYNEWDRDWWLNLIKLIVLNDPTKNCIIQGNISLQQQLDKEKSLFFTDGKGLPIGNLTSQIFSTLYLTDLDKWLSSEVQGYGRYVDDIIMLDTDKDKLLKLLPKIRTELKKLNLKINPKKIVIQQCYKGIPFIGYIVKDWGIYPGEKLYKTVKKFTKVHKNLDVFELVQRANSYFGFLSHLKTFNIRKQFWESIRTNYKNIYCMQHINYLKIYKNNFMKINVTMPANKFAYIERKGKFNVIRWNPIENTEDNTILCEEDAITGIVTESRVRNLIESSINKDTDEKILNGFVWTPSNENDGYSVYLSTENQFNFKAAYDLAVQTSGQSLPITFKFSRDGSAVYHEFTSLDEFSDFYVKSVQHINQCLNEGWQKKDSIDYSKYL